MNHDAGIWEAMPFPFFACAGDRNVSMTGALCGSMGTNRRRGEETPWMQLDPRNKCVLVMKRTREGKRERTRGEGITLRKNIDKTFHSWWRWEGFC
jgi:hypothetical protein